MEKKELGVRVKSTWDGTPYTAVVVARMGDNGIIYLNDEVAHNGNVVSDAEDQVRDEHDFIVLWETGRVEWGFDNDGDFVVVE